MESWETALLRLIESAVLGAAPLQPMDALVQTFPQTVLLQRQDHVLGAGRLEPAFVPHTVRSESLINFYQANDDPFQKQQ